MTSPPFSGFPDRAFRFLRGLEKNNNREWFQAHKQEYLDHVVAPAQSFIVTFGKALQRTFPAIRYDARTNGAGSLGRIYRDIRFSPDKTPYNTHVWFSFWEGSGRKMRSPGFGIGFDTEGWGILGGRHRFEKPELERFRKAVVDKTMGPTLEAAMKPLRNGGRYEIGELSYKRVPRGFDTEHPRAHWLRYGGLWAHREFDGTKLLRSPKFVDRCLEITRELAPLHRWLVAVEKGRPP